ncbi:MAG: NDP-sugar synthase, partial [Endomicrobia bacterium]|nr:NDP-sugar synthase [Endomicrobiia bacterium]
PEAVTEYFAGRDTGVNLTFSKEKKLLGTAGAVKKNENFFDDTFVVMSGDGLTDINLKKALEFHKKSKALATIVLKRIEARFEYGITVTGKNGRVERFIEKPRWGDIFTNTVNTGIYVLEPEVFKYMPKNKFFDFSMDLFPLLLKRKKNIYGYVMEEYWTDIGNIFEYKKGIFDALDGKINIEIDGVKSGHKYVNNSARIGKNVKISGPCFVGANVKIGDNAVIKPYSVISKNAVIGNNAEIERSVIWGGSRISRGARLSNTIVGYKSKIPAGMALFDSIIMS